MLKELLGALDSVDQKIHRLEQAIRKQVKGYEDLIQRLCRIPGVEVVTSRTILADGVDMTPVSRRRSLDQLGGPLSWSERERR